MMSVFISLSGIATLILLEDITAGKRLSKKMKTKIESDLMKCSARPLLLQGWGPVKENSFSFSFS